ncbi:MAG TPA: lytic transglycosylase domain-containing protein, partial [Candidatus Competibacteraceae bacterium]|nr:lytic transglycosylase domain-containing protein [Candidatus Competibacteraceae bacterium]
AEPERFDPAKNIRAGIRYLKVLAQMFGGNLDLMVAAYNAGEGAVLKYGRHIPPYRETQTYVRRVKGFYARYRQRVRQRQMLASMLDADERRLMDRSRTAEDARDRELARERSLMGE